MPQSWDMGQILLLPLRRNAYWEFSGHPKNPTASAGFEPANSGSSGQHANHRSRFGFVTYWYIEIKCKGNVFYFPFLLMLPEPSLLRHTHLPVNNHTVFILSNWNLPSVVCAMLSIYPLFPFKAIICGAIIGHFPAVTVVWMTKQKAADQIKRIW